MPRYESITVESVDQQGNKETVAVFRDTLDGAFRAVDSYQEQTEDARDCIGFEIV